MNEVPQDVKEFAFKWFIDQLKKKQIATFSSLWLLWWQSCAKENTELLFIKPVLCKRKCWQQFQRHYFRNDRFVRNWCTLTCTNSDILTQFVTALININRYYIYSLTPLVKYKSQDQNFQLLYQALFCLWMLTFNSEVKEKMTDPELVFNLVEILKQVEVLKVRRMTIATLRVSLMIRSSVAIIHWRS